MVCRINGIHIDLFLHQSTRTHSFKNTHEHTHTHTPPQCFRNKRPHYQCVIFIIFFVVVELGFTAFPQLVMCFCDLHTHLIFTPSVNRANFISALYSRLPGAYASTINSHFLSTHFQGLAKQLILSRRANGPTPVHVLLKAPDTQS